MALFWARTLSLGFGWLLYSRGRTGDFSQGFPPVQKVLNVFQADFGGVFEVALLLRDEKFYSAVQHGEAGNALFQRDLIFRGEIEIFVVLADIAVHDDEIGFENFGDVGIMKSGVEHMAVVAPVAAEIEEDAAVFAGGDGESHANVGASFGGIGIKIGLGFDRLRKAREIGALRGKDYGLAVLLDPILGDGGEAFGRAGGRLQIGFESEDDAQHAGLRRIEVDDFRFEARKAGGFQLGPER